jgi:hypothetical protein
MKPPQYVGEILRKGFTAFLNRTQYPINAFSRDALDFIEPEIAGLIIGNLALIVVS